MKRILIYKKKTKQVEMISEGKIKYDKKIFAEKQMNLTPTKFKELLNSERIIIKGSNLTLTPRIDKKEKKKELEQELENATDLNKLKQIIKKLL